MSGFVVRTVSRTAGGREIVRTREVPGQRLTIGREAGNDIQIADLAVDPQHAIVSFEGGRLTVETLNGLRFGVDGRAKAKALLDPAQGAELRFGAHVLVISEDGGRPVLTIERVGAVSDVGEDRDESVFTLRAVAPGKRALAWTFGLAILAVFLAWPIMSFGTWNDVKTRPQAALHADAAWSTGPLSQAHHALENDCQACHDQAFEAVSDTKCSACHVDTHLHANPQRQVAAMAPPSAFKRAQNLFKVSFGYPTGQRCVDCHTEHQGAGPMPATASNFCTDCHGSMKARLPDTKLANAGSFATAHPNFMPAVSTGFRDDQPLVRRIAFSTAMQEDNGLKFPHALHLSRVNGVAQMGIRNGTGALECADCHRRDPSGVRFEPVDMERDCQGCHSLGFQRVGGVVRTLRHGDVTQTVADLRMFGGGGGGANYAGARRRPGDAAVAVRGGVRGGVDAPFLPGGACYDCHVIDRSGGAATNGWHIRVVHQPKRYLTKGWFDHSAHRTEGCTSCHAGATRSNDARALLLPALDKGANGKGCRDCHGDEKQRRVAVPSSCATCHSYHDANSAPWHPRGSSQRNSIGRDRLTVAMR